MIPVLPLDVIENIIDILVNENPRSLPYVKAFSLTCQSFLPLCRKHIFSSIDVEITDSLEHLHSGEAFGRFLLETPGIAKHVRQLSVRIEHHSESGYFFDQVSRQLTRLRSLTILCSTLGEETVVAWRDISSSMQRSLLSLIRLPTLTHLDLSSIRHFLISDLITCTNLKHLCTNGLFTADANDDEVFSVLHKPIQLQVFVTMLTPAVSKLLGSKCSDGRPVLDFTLLKKLRIVLHWTGHAHKAREIFSGTQQLTDVDVTVADITFRIMDFANMITPSLQTLRRLRLSIDGWEMSDPVPDLCNQLETISGKNRLESIEIENHVQSDEWDRLDRILLAPGWPMLERVSLTIVIFVSEINSPFKRIVENLAQNKLSGLMSSKNLDFHFLVQEHEIAR